MDPNHYMITDNAANGAGSFDSAYHHLTDHTGDSLGGMLLVNASEAPGIVYTSIQGGLCPNTEFNFSAWVVNVSPDTMGTCGVAHPIHVEFEIQTISGERLAVRQTGEIGEVRWVERQVGQEFSVILIRGVKPES